MMTLEEKIINVFKNNFTAWELEKIYQNTSDEYWLQILDKIEPEEAAL